MANILSKGSLFPEELIPGFIQKTTGASALAKLCGATPIPFNGQKEFTFTLDKRWTSWPKTVPRARAA